METPSKTTHMKEKCSEENDISLNYVLRVLCTVLVQNAFSGLSSGYGNEHQFLLGTFVQVIIFLSEFPTCNHKYGGFQCTILTMKKVRDFYIS
jgi:hypothetical protein